LALERERINFEYPPEEPLQDAAHSARGIVMIAEPTAEWK